MKGNQCLIPSISKQKLFLRHEILKVNAYEGKDG